jgi:outer membrane protein assembly factor BamD
MILMTASRRLVRILPALSVVIAFAFTGCATNKDKDDQSSVDKLYADAMEDAASANYERAIKALSSIEGKGAGSLLSQQAQLELAYLYWKTQDKAQAISTLDRFIKLHPSSPALDYALYLRGLVNFNDDLGFLGVVSGQALSERDQEASRESFASFKQLVEQFPNSKYAPDAKIRMDYTVNALAEYQVHVARYYLRRGAFVAAANRAQQCVTEFPQTASTAEALAIMVRAYDQLGLTQLRDDADRVLKKNFPASEFVEGNVRKPWWKLW